MSAQVHTFLHHDPHIHHPSLHHPHPHRITRLSQTQRNQLSGWNGLLWTDYLNADGFSATRDIAAEQEEELEMLSDSSEEEMIEEQKDQEHDYCSNPEHHHPQRPLSPELKPRENVEVHEIKETEHDYCTLHDHPARPLSPPLRPRKAVEHQKTEEEIEEERFPGISHYEDWQHDYCTLHDHPVRPLSPPLMPRKKAQAPAEHSDYCTLHDHPARPLSPPLLPRKNVAVQESQIPTEELPGVSSYEDWMDEFAWDRAQAQLADLKPLVIPKDTQSMEVEIEEEVWSDAPETPDTEEPEPLEDFGIAAGSYNRRASLQSTEDIEQAPTHCTCDDEECKAYLADKVRNQKYSRAQGLNMHPIYDNLPVSPRGSW